MNENKKELHEMTDEEFEEEMEEFKKLLEEEKE